jgi:hypothetical protein
VRFKPLSVRRKNAQIGLENGSPLNASSGSPRHGDPSSLAHGKAPSAFDPYSGHQIDHDSSAAEPRLIGSRYASKSKQLYGEARHGRQKCRSESAQRITYPGGHRDWLVRHNLRAPDEWGV